MFGILDIIVIIAYVLCLVGISWFASQKVKNAKDFIGASRGLGIIVMIGSLAGAAIGAVGTIGLAADVYTTGISGYWQIIGWNIGWVTLVIMAKRLWATGASSIVDVFGGICGRNTRLLASVACLGFAVPALASQLIGLGNMFVTVCNMAGWEADYKLLVFIAAVIMVAAVFKGGLYSSAYTGTFNFFVLAILFVICLPIFTFKAAGGVNQAVANVEALPSSYLDMFAGVSVTATLGTILRFCFTAGSNIAYVGNTLAAKDAKTARNGSIGGIISYFIIPGIIMISVLMLIKVFPNVENTDGILTYIFMNIFPPAIRGLSVVALIAVVLSTATIWVQNSGKILGSDIYGQLKKDATDDQILRASKIATIVCSVIAFVMAMFVPQIMVMYNYTSTLYGSSLFFPLVAVLFWKKATRQGISAGIIVGMVSSIVCMVFGITDSPVIVGSLLNGLAIIVVSLMTQNSAETAAAAE